MSTPRLGFAGTPEFAAIILERLLDEEADVALVLTQPDRPRGRGRRVRPSPVKVLATKHGIAVSEPDSLRGYDLTGAHLTVLIVAAYGLILPPQVLEAPALGCVNVHASLLPRWRGAAPVERAIMAGDSETGVCLMQMDEGLDTGPIYACERLPIGTTETGGVLERRLADAGARLLVDLLPRLGTIEPSPQPQMGVTYAQKISARDRRLDFRISAESAARQIRALADRAPVTVTAPGANLRIRLLNARALAAASGAPPGTIIACEADGLRVACVEGTLVIEQVQLNRGKGRPMSASAAANGFPELFSAGAVLRALDPP